MIACVETRRPRLRIAIAALFLAPALGGCIHAAPRFALPQRFTALGTEPFWAAKVDGGRLIYSTPLDHAGRAISITRHAAARVATVEGVLDGRLLRLRIRAGPCSDGMSDVVYPFAVERTVGDDVQHGCARGE